MVGRRIRYKGRVEGRSRVTPCRPFVARNYFESRISRRSALPHQTGLVVFPHTAFRCPSPRGMRLRPARCRRHFVEPVLSVQIPFGEPGVPCFPISDLVSLSQMRAHPLFQVPSHSTELFAAIAKVKVPHPATHRRVDLADQPVHGHHCPCPRRQLGDAILNRFQGLLRRLDVSVSIND